MIFFPILMPPRFELHRFLAIWATYLSIFFVASHGAFAVRDGESVEARSS